MGEAPDTEREEARKKYQGDLTAAEREELLRLSRSGKTSGRKLTRARILLKADEGLSDEEIAEEVGTSVPTIERTRRRFVAENLGALTERARSGQRPRLAAKGEAHLIAVACSKAPGERKRWTLRLLADKAVELGLCEKLSYETVRGLLKKTRQALAVQAVVPSGGKCGVCRLYGGRLGSLCRALRSPPSEGELR